MPRHLGDETHQPSPLGNFGWGDTVKPWKPDEAVKRQRR